MADVNIQMVRLLGFGELRDIERLHRSVAAVPGPAVRVVFGQQAAALVQDEPSIPLARRSNNSLLDTLRSIHRRLEQACQEGEFLPFDPGAACCPKDVVEQTLEMSWSDVAGGLARAGGYHQWDVVLRWSPDLALIRHRAALALVARQHDAAALGAAVGDVLRGERARREACLLAALSDAVAAISDSGAVGTDTEVAVTVLVSRGGEDAIEDALTRIPAELVGDVSVDLRGPMPPVSFAAVRLVRINQADVGRSWRVLGLPERADATSLHRQWRALAATTHPDRFANDANSAISFQEITDAYRLLRSLVGAQSESVRSLARRTGYRIVVPAFSVATDASVEDAA